MARVNIRDRVALERLYPEDAFANEASRNEQPDAVTRGLRIGSAPDKDGCFELERASRHAGEPETPYFLAPQKSQDYRRFLDEVIVAAERFGFRGEETPGQGDARIRGLRGG
jgi:hypothetical protein